MDFQRSRATPAFPRLRSERRRSRKKKALIAFLVVSLVGGTLTAAAIATNTFRAGDYFDRFLAKVDRFLAGPPPPDRATVATELVTPAPATPSPSPTPTLEPVESGKPRPTPKPTPTPVPRVPVKVDIVKDHDAVFAHEIKDTWCAPAGVTITLAILGKARATDATQREIASRIHEWETYSDSHNYDWGPSAMVLALSAYGATGYHVRAYETRQDALRGAAKAISVTHSPAILLAWNGAHTWVMSGYKADADPVAFDDATITGAYILDPWFPDYSSLWGQSDPPGTFQDNSEMIRNFRPWARPEGQYAGRDGYFIVVEPSTVFQPG